MVKNWKFDLGEFVMIPVSEESGDIIGRAEYQGDEDRYLLRYKAGDGRAVEVWWPGSALSSRF